MPKVKEYEYVKLKRTFNAVLKYGMEISNLSYEDVAKAMHETRMTLYRRRKNPDDITLRELRAISKAIKMPISKLVGETE